MKALNAAGIIWLFGGCIVAITTGNEPCRIPLMAGHNVKLTSSSIYGVTDPFHMYGPSRAHLNTTEDFDSQGHTLSGGWVADTKDFHPYIQVELEKASILRSIITQGRNGCCKQWTKQYKVEYSPDCKTWAEIDTFQGNSDENTPVRNDFKCPVAAKCVRVSPLDWNNQPNNEAALRFEVLGCGIRSKLDATAPTTLMATSSTTQSTSSSTATTTKTTQTTTASTPTSPSTTKTTVSSTSTVTTPTSTTTSSSTPAVSTSKTTSTPLTTSTQSTSTSSTRTTTTGTLSTSTVPSMSTPSTTTPTTTSPSTSTTSTSTSQSTSTLSSSTKSVMSSTTGSTVASTPISTQMTTAKTMSTTSMTSSRTPASTMPTTTSGCTDNPSVNCTELDVTLTICQNQPMAIKYCPLYCNVCPWTTTVTQTTSAPSTTIQSTTPKCSDNPSVNCTDLDSTLNICQNAAMAQKYCEKHCGVCPQTTTTTASTPTSTLRTTTPTTTKSAMMMSSSKIPVTMQTTNQSCSDKPGVNCTEMNSTLSICQNVAMATKYCQKYCGNCPKTTTATSTASVHPSTSVTAVCTDNPSVDCKDMNDTLSICQNYNMAQKYCPKYCSACPMSTTSPVPSTTPKCADNQHVNCTDMNKTLSICQNSVMAQRYCQKYCGVCPQSTTSSHGIMFSTSVTGSTPVTPTTTPVQSTTVQCTDAVGINCTDMNTTLGICQSPNMANQYCKLFCNMCGQKTAVSGSPSPQTPVCTDNPSLNCSDLDLTLGLCKNGHMAQMYCPHYCGICSSTSTIVPTTSGTPVTSTGTSLSSNAQTTASLCSDNLQLNCQDMNKTLSICSNVRMANAYCPFFCTRGMCTSLLGNTTTVVSVKPLTVSQSFSLSTSNPCADNPNVNCTFLNTSLGICQNQNMGMQYCPQFCNMCTNTSTTPTLSTLPIATKAPCKNTQTINCNQLNSSLHICQDKKTAGLYCSAFCGLCSNLSTTSPLSNTTKVSPGPYKLTTVSSSNPNTSTAQQSSGTTTTATISTSMVSHSNLPKNCTNNQNVDCKLLNTSLGICKDITTGPLYCPVFCGLCNSTLSLSSTMTAIRVSTVTSSVSTSNSPLSSTKSSLSSVSSLVTNIASNSTSAASTKLSGNILSNTTIPQTSTTQSTTRDPCTDNPSVNCTFLNNSLGICSNVNTGLKYCPKFCKLCYMFSTTPSQTTASTSSTLLSTSTSSNSSNPASVVTSSQATTIDPCVDTHNINCSFLNSTLFLCSNIPSGFKYCPKYCKLCYLFSTTQAFPSTIAQAFSTQYVSTQSTVMQTTPNQCVDNPNLDCNFLNTTVGICSNGKAGQQYCSKFCGFCSSTVGFLSSSVSPSHFNSSVLNLSTVSSTGPSQSSSTGQSSVLTSSTVSSAGSSHASSTGLNSLGLSSTATSAPTMNTNQSVTTITTPVVSASSTIGPSVPLNLHSTTKNPCKDNPTINCTQMNATLGLCQNFAIAKAQCPQFCNLCKITLLPGPYKSNVTTTAVSLSTSSPTSKSPSSSSVPTTLSSLLISSTVSSTPSTSSAKTLNITQNSTLTTTPPSYTTSSAGSPSMSSNAMSTSVSPNLSSSNVTSLTSTQTPSVNSTSAQLTTPNPCKDNPTMNCQKMNTSLGLCIRDVTLAKKHCPKYCGLCPSSVSAATNNINNNTTSAISASLMASSTVGSSSTPSPSSSSAGTSQSTLSTAINNSSTPPSTGSSFSATALLTALSTMNFSTNPSSATGASAGYAASPTTTSGTTSFGSSLSSQSSAMNASTSPGSSTAPASSSSSQPTTTLAQPTTTPVCADQANMNCSFLNKSLGMCSTTQAALVYCPKFCKICPLFYASLGSTANIQSVTTSPGTTPLASSLSLSVSVLGSTTSNTGSSPSSSVPSTIPSSGTTLQGSTSSMRSTMGGSTSMNPSLSSTGLSSPSSSPSITQPTTLSGASLGSTVQGQSTNNPTSFTSPSSSSQSTTTTIQTTTTPVCADLPNMNCSFLNTSLGMCSNKKTALAYCPKYCKICPIFYASLKSTVQPHVAASSTGMTASSLPLSTISHNASFISTGPTLSSAVSGTQSVSSATLTSTTSMIPTTSPCLDAPGVNCKDFLVLSPNACALPGFQNTCPKFCGIC